MTSRGCLIVAAVAGFIVAAPARADDYAGLVKSLVDSSFRHMALTFACQRYIGDAHYHAARTIAEGNLELAGFGRDEAVLHVDQMDQKLKADARPAPKGISAQVCLSQMAETMQKLKVAQAEMRIFLSKQPGDPAK